MPTDTQHSRIPQLMTDTQAMDALGIDKMTLQTLINDGQFTAYLFPEQALRLISDEVEEYRREHETPLQG